MPSSSSGMHRRERRLDIPPTRQPSSGSYSTLVSGSLRVCLAMKAALNSSGAVVQGSYRVLSRRGGQQDTVSCLPDAT